MGEMMGYTTEFEGHFTIDPPLNAREVTYLRAFARTRHVRTTYGPYVVTVDDDYGTPPVPITDHNHPPEGVPGLWCQWEVSGDGTQIAWDGGEKFYEPEAWLRFLVDTFLRPGATLQEELTDPTRVGWAIPDALTHFTFDHVVSGVVLAQGRAFGDSWTLVAEDNVITRHEGHSAPDPDPDPAPEPVTEVIPVTPGDVDTLVPLAVDESIGVLAEGVHTALRKAIDSSESGVAWRAIRDLPAGEWHAAMRWLVESLDDPMNIVLARRGDTE